MGVSVCVCPQALLQMVQSHDGSIRSVMEKGDALLASVHYPSIRDKMHRIQKDYTALCKAAMVGTSSDAMAIRNKTIFSSAWRAACFTFSFCAVCGVQAHVENLEGQVKEQEAYHNELQEVERWLLQMSSRMVTPDPSVSVSLEAATQQLARHKVTNHIISLLLPFAMLVTKSCSLSPNLIIATELFIITMLMSLFTYFIFCVAIL